MNEWVKVAYKMCMKVKVAQLCLTLFDPMDYTVHGILQERILEWVAYPFSRGFSQPRNQTRVSCIAGRFLTSWATREVQKYSECYSVVSSSLQLHGLYRPWNCPGQNTGVDNRSLLWGIFPTQESNQGLLHCRQILYQLSHQGSPCIKCCESQWQTR